MASSCAGSAGTSAALVRPPAGSVGLLVFYENEDAASEASDVFKSERGELLTGSVASRLEVHGSAVLLWRLPAHDSDRSLVAACLKSSGHASEPDAEPAKPLGCVQMFLVSNATLSQVQQVEDALRGERLVGTVQFVSKIGALELLRKRHPELTRNLKETRSRTHSVSLPSVAGIRLSLRATCGRILIST